MAGLPRRHVERWGDPQLEVERAHVGLPLNPMTGAIPGDDEGEAILTHGRIEPSQPTRVGDMLSRFMEAARVDTPAPDIGVPGRAETLTVTV
jgi:hypothetical protein